VNYFTKDELLSEIKDATNVIELKSGESSIGLIFQMNDKL